MKTRIFVVATLAISAVLLAGCGSTGTVATPTPSCAQLLDDNKTCIPTTDTEVIDLVRSRFSSCLAKFGDEYMSPTYMTKTLDSFLPGTVTFFFSPPGTNVVIDVSNYLKPNVLDTTVAPVSADLTFKAGCK
jgi:hypothetical protein